MNHAESRPAHELTEADLQRHPVWQFRVDAEGTDDADESHAVPAPSGLCLGEFGSFIVQASFLLKNGRKLPGAVQVDLLGTKALFTPAFIYAQGKTLDPLAADAETRIGRILKMSNARPASWCLDETFVGESQRRTGRIARSGMLQALSLLVRLIALRFARRSQ